MEAMVPRLALSYPALMREEHRRLYGIGWSPRRPLALTAIIRALLNPLAAPLERAIPTVRSFVDEHAFGARHIRVDPGPKSETLRALDA